MLSFLPQKNTEQVVTEYTLRYWVVALASVCIALLVLILFFLPTFFSALFKDQAGIDRLSSVVRTDQNGTMNTLASITSIDATARVFTHTDPSSLSISDLIENIASLKEGSVRITGISVSTNGNFSKDITVSGTVGTVDDLTAFYNSLRTENTFQTVNLPVVSSTTTVPIPFQMVLYYAN